MALKQVLMNATGAPTASLTLSPKVGESILVKGIYVSSAPNNYLRITTNKTTVGFFDIGTIFTNHLQFPKNGYYDLNILDKMIAKGIMKGYPVADGESITFSTTNGASVYIAVKYEVYDSQDIKSTDPNGSNSSEYAYVNYGTSSKFATDVNPMIDTPLNPSEFPSFPYNEVVPSRTKITLYGIASIPFSKSTGTNANVQLTNYLKFIRDRSVLFDEGKNGLYFYPSNTSPTADGTYYGGYTLIGSSSDKDNLEYFDFPNPLEFSAGDELNVYLITTVSKGVINFVATDFPFAFIEKVAITTGA